MFRIEFNVSNYYCSNFDKLIKRNKNSIFILKLFNSSFSIETDFLNPLNLLINIGSWTFAKSNSPTIIFIIIKRISHFYSSQDQPTDKMEISKENLPNTLLMLIFKRNSSVALYVRLHEFLLNFLNLFLCQFLKPHKHSN